MQPHSRRRHNPAAGDELTQVAVASPFNIETAAAQNQLFGRVKGALETLPAEQRAAIELAYFEGMSQREIAEYTKTSLGTIKTRMRIGMEKLERLLRASGYPE